MKYSIRDYSSNLLLLNIENKSTDGYFSTCRDSAAQAFFDPTGSGAAKPVGLKQAISEGNPTGWKLS